MPKKTWIPNQVGDDSGYAFEDDNTKIPFEDDTCARFMNDTTNPVILREHEQLKGFTHPCLPEENHSSD